MAKEQKPTLSIDPKQIARIRKMMAMVERMESEIDSFKEEILTLHNERLGTQDCAKGYDLGLFSAIIAKSREEVLESVYRDTLEDVCGENVTSELFETTSKPEVVNIQGLIKAMTKNKLNPDLVLEVKLKKGFEPSVLAIYDTGAEDSPVKCYKVLVPKADFFKTCYVMWKGLKTSGKDLVRELASKMFSLTLKKI